MMLYTKTELKQKKNNHAKKVQKRLTEYKESEEDGRPKKKPRSTASPQQEYCRACPSMRMFTGCVQSGTCKLCKDNFAAGRPFDANCTMCACTCTVGVFTENMIVDIAIKLQQSKQLGARKKEQDTYAHLLALMGDSIKNSISDGMMSLLQSNSRVNNGNILSSAAAQFLRKGM